MVFSNLIVYAIYFILLLFYSPLISTDSGHKKVIIHIPMKIKSHMHTHTVYKHVHHGSKVQFKVLGLQQAHMYDHEVNDDDEEDYVQSYKYNGPRFWKKYG